MSKTTVVAVAMYVLLSPAMSAEGLCQELPGSPIFCSGFEEGDTSSWGVPFCEPAADVKTAALQGSFLVQINNSPLTLQFESTISDLGWELDFDQGVEILPTYNIKNQVPIDARFAMIPAVDGAGNLQGLYGYTSSDIASDEGADLTVYLNQNTIRIYTTSDLAEWVDLVLDFDNHDCCNPEVTTMINVAGSSLYINGPYRECFAAVMAQVISLGRAVNLDQACINSCITGVVNLCVACAVGAGVVVGAAWWQCS